MEAAGMSARATWVLAAAMAATGAQAQLAWRQDTGAVALVRDARTLWQFHYGTNATKPFFHPLAPVGGPVLTVDRPSDHRWHHGLWFSWKFINGVNYWEEDAATGRSAGTTEWGRPRIETRPDFSARIGLELVYRVEDAKPVLSEKRVIEVSAPGADGSYTIDWMMTFASLGGEVLLDRTPLPGEPGGKSWGGYAGLSLRFPKEMGSLSLTTSEGAAAFTEGVFRGKGAAFDYSGRFEDGEGGIAMLNDPGNPVVPAPWYATDNGGLKFFNAALLEYRPYTLKPGQTLTLRYRVIVHSGRWGAEQLRGALEKFVPHH
jgi:hypothetical protein